MEAHSLIENDGGDLSEMYTEWQTRLDPPREPRDKAGDALSVERSSISTLRKSEVDTDTKPIPASRIRQGYQPMTLRPVFLIGFAVTFVILAVVLGSLYAWSGRNHGLGTSDEKWRYVFRYGPTAVLTIVAVFWSKIEYRTKQMAPWKQMSEGFAPAKATMLLDYITPLNIVTLPLATQARQFAVAAAISGTFLIQLLIIISTGLLALENRLIEHKHANLLANDKFDAASFNVSRVDSRPYLSVYGIGYLNQSFPAGTTAQHAFQSFNASHASDAANSTMKAMVDVLSTDLECRNGNGSLYYIPHSGGGGLTASTPDCSVQSEVTNLSWEGYIGYMMHATCVNQTGEDAQRLLICTAHMHSISPQKQPDGSYIAPQGATDNTTCLICRPTYRRTPGMVTVSGDSSVASTVTIAEDATNTPIPSLSPWDLGYATLSSMNGTAAALNASTLITDETGFFQLVNYTSPLLQPWRLLDEDYLMSSSRKAFQLLAAQVAHSYLMVPARVTVLGSYSTSERRLCFQAVSFYAMESLFIVLILLAVFLSFLHRKPFVSRDIGSLAGLSTILAQSHNAMKSVTGTGRASMLRLKNHLSDCAYGTAAFYDSRLPTFQVLAAPGSAMRGNSSSSDAVTTKKMRWWRPFALTFWGRLLTCLAPVALIVMLQALLHKSQTADGLATVPEVPNIHYAWTLIPAAISLGVATLFYTFQTALRLVQPYQTLKNGGVPARACLFDDYNAELALHTIWHAAYRRHVALLASTIAVLCAPFLTIAVSGLYKTGDVSSTYPAQLQVKGWFNTTVDSSVPGVIRGQVNSANVNVLSSLLVYRNNTSFSNWTTPQLAIAELGTSKKAFVPELMHALEETNSVSSLSAMVPAIWPVMNCTAQPFESASWAADTSSYWSEEGDQYEGGPWLNISVRVLDECNGALYSWFGSTESSVSDGIWQTGLSFGDRVSSGWKSFPDLIRSPNCPTAMVVFGEATKKETIHDDLTVIMCKPFTWYVEANVTFDMPGFGLSGDHLWPDFNASMGSPFNNESAWTLLRTQGLPNLVFDAALVPVNTTDIDPRIGQIDGFFQTLLQSPLATFFDEVNTTDPLSTYLGVSNSPNLIDSMQNLYGLVMSQLLNSRKRIPVTGSGWTGTAVSGNITSLDHQRLYQDAASTYVLTALLSVMFICAVIATLTSDTRYLLPKNPCSVAAVASLLAGSEILSAIPPGSEWCDDRELKRRGLFDGYLFSMGWWGKEGSPERKFGIDVGKAERAG